ncbi:mechanosensitive ion channel family protein [Clostridium carnis]
MGSYLAFFKLASTDGGYKVQIEWENLEKVLDKGLKIISILILMYFIIKIGDKIIDKFVEKQIKSKLSFSMNKQKALTVGAILKSSLKYLVYIAGAGWIITSTLNISVAMLGAGGFVIGIGAQSLVKDLINGFFILFEDQYGVGDHVTIGSYSGIVETIGIRTTVLRDFTGDLHVITNGSILEVTNHSRGDIRFIVDVEIAYEESVDRTIDLIGKVCEAFERNNEDEIRGKIEVLGVTSLNASGVTIRVVGKAKPLTQWRMERELRKDIKKALDAEGIEIPYPKTQLINSK